MGTSLAPEEEVAIPQVTPEGEDRRAGLGGCTGYILKP
jgi:hypothetical protein